MIETMRKSVLFLFSVLAVLLLHTAAYAQTPVVPDGYELVDSVIYVPTAQLDSALVGFNVFSEVTVHQSQSIADAMKGQLERNAGRPIAGYRVRIFFDNSQSSRTASEAVLKAFNASHPGCAAYRSYVNPYFKVTVGDFRSRTEAMQMLRILKPEYPSAFIVKENINYPVVDAGHSYVTDTVKVLRRIEYFNN